VNWIERNLNPDHKGEQTLQRLLAGLRAQPEGHDETARHREALALRGLLRILALT
jgi:hypothetical protein